MDTNNENYEDAKSKIEKIRLDLEKKLAALEASKIKNEPDEVEDKIEESKEEVVKKEETPEVISEVNIKEEIQVEEESAFLSGETFFEINDKIENVVREEEKKKEEVKVEEKIVEEKIVVVPPPIAPSNIETIKKEAPKEKAEEPEEEEKRNPVLNYIIFALSALILVSLGYLGWNYFKDGNLLKENESNKLLIEYENRRYNDSIELAEANNLLLDLQSQRYIDSISIVNQLEFEDQSGNSGISGRQANTTRRPARINRNRTTAANNPVNNENSNTESVENTGTEKPEGANEGLEEGSNTDVAKEGSEESTTPIDDKKEEVTTSSETKPEDSTKKVAIKRPETLSTIEESPLYPGCESKGTELQKKQCLMSKISKYVAKNFDSSLSQDLGLEEGRKKINVSFVIDKSGSVNVLKVRAQHKVLEQEALRVVNSLPKMQPGKKNGKTEPVIYNLPIVYKVEY